LSRGGAYRAPLTSPMPGGILIIPMQQPNFMHIIPGLIVPLLFLSCAGYESRNRAASVPADHDRAIPEYPGDITLDPKDTDGYFNRGMAYRNTGDYDLAIADFSEVIRLDPTDAEAWYQRGNAYYQKGSYDQAIADYDQAIGLDPKNEAYRFNRITTSIRRDGGDSTEGGGSLAGKAPPSPPQSPSPPLGTQENPYDWSTRENQLLQADIPSGSYIRTGRGTVRVAEDSEIEWAKKMQSRQ